MAQRLGNGQRHNVVGYPKTDGILLAFEDLRHLLTCGKDESERAGDMAFQEAESGRGYGLRVFGEIAEVVANERQVRFCGVYMLDPADTFNSLGVKDITAEPVHCIGRIYDDTPVCQAGSHLFDEPLLWILGMYLEQHKFFFERP